MCERRSARDPIRKAGPEPGPARALRAMWRAWMRAAVGPSRAGCRRAKSESSGPLHRRLASHLPRRIARSDPPEDRGNACAGAGPDQTYYKAAAHRAGPSGCRPAPGTAHHLKLLVTLTSASGGSFNGLKVPSCAAPRRVAKVRHPSHRR